MRLRRLAPRCWQDLTYGIGMLYRQPGHSAVALLTIALGIGATTLVFSVVHASLLAPLPYPDAIGCWSCACRFPTMRTCCRRLDASKTRASAAAISTLSTTSRCSAVWCRRPLQHARCGARRSGGRSTRATCGSGRGAEPRLVAATFRRRSELIGRTVQLSGLRVHDRWRDAAWLSVSVTGVPALGEHGRRHDPGAAAAENRALRIFQAVGRVRPTLTQAQAKRSSRRSPIGWRRLIPTRTRAYADARLGSRSARRRRPHGASRCACIRGLSALHRVRECRQPDARAYDVPNPGARGPCGDWRGTLADREATCAESLLTAVCGGVAGRAARPLGHCWRCPHSSASACRSRK